MIALWSVWFVEIQRGAGLALTGPAQQNLQEIVASDGRIVVHIGETTAGLSLIHI